MKNSKASIVLALMLPYSASLAFGQQKSTPAQPHAIERFFGTWELHLATEHPDVPTHESLTIERTESGIKITHLVEFENDTVLHYWGVMDPKGSFVQMRETNGKPMNEEWRIVSVDPDSLVIETRPFGGKREYLLSADGQTMKMIRLTAVLKLNPPLPDLIFQKTK
jgi:hypothetical protein